MTLSCEHFELGEHTALVKEILVANRGDVNVYLAEKSARREARLQEKYHESFQDLERICFQMQHHEGKTKADQVQWMLATIMATGARKIEILDPHVTYVGPVRQAAEGREAAIGHGQRPMGHPLGPQNLPTS